MGWSFSSNPAFGRKEQIQEIRSDRFWAPGYKPVCTRVVGNRVWTLLDHAGCKSISLTLIRGGGRGYGYGYKGMHEDDHPYYYDCPLSLIDLAGPAASESARQWRQHVCEYHATEANRPKPESGKRLTYGNELYELEQPAGPRRGWIVARVRDGQRFRMSARVLSSASLEQDTSV